MDTQMWGALIPFLLLGGALIAGIVDLRLTKLDTVGHTPARQRELEK